MNWNRKKLIITAAIAVGSVALGLLAAQGVLMRQAAVVQPPAISSLLWPNPKQLAAFSLQDQGGQAFDLARLEGRWTLLFFGYTHCPDVCPITLAALRAMIAELKGLDPVPGTPAGGVPSDVQVALVTVDPARDTPEKLAHYMAFFDPAFLGVSGSDEALEGLTGQLGVVYRRYAPDAAGEYLVDHTAGVLLIDPKMRLVGLFRSPHDPAIMSGEFSAIREFIAKQG